MAAGVPGGTLGCWCTAAGEATVTRGLDGGLCSCGGALRPHGAWFQAGPREALGGGGARVG